VQLVFQTPKSGWPEHRSFIRNVAREHRLAGVYGSIIVPLGVDDFRQSDAPTNLYQHYGIDAPAIVNGAMLALQRCGL